MTWTYGRDPAASNRDAVRFLVGDTDNADPLVTDEEIAYALTLEPTNTLTAARVAEALAAKFSRYANQSVGDLSISYSDRVRQLKELAKQLRAEGTISAATPFAGGISAADKASRASDSDRVVTAVKVGVHDNPET